jgi:hypothetical protein
MNTTKTLALCFVFGLLSNLVFAQNVLLSEEVDSTYKVSKVGPNRQHFVHGFFSLGFLLGENEELENIKFGSNTFSVGLRYKLRLTNHIATGVDLEYRLSNVFYPTKKPILKEKYAFVDLKYDWYLRLNFGKRGDIIGKYLDLGVWASYMLMTSQYTKSEFKNLDYKYIEQTQKSLKYFNGFNYGLFARFGVNQFALFVEYRYSDIIKSDFKTIYNNIPPWTVGIQIGFHR